MQTWPNWQPGMELGAEHLVGLESFLLCRSEIAEGGCRGVEDFDLGSSILVRRVDAMTLEFEVSHLRGVTPGSQPVMLRGEDRLAKKVSLPEEGEGCFDLGIELNVPGSPEKMMLRVVARGAETDSEAPLPDGLLDLGGFRLDADGLLELVRRPPLRRLDALKPLDHRWREWVEPLRAAIESLAAKLEEERLTLPMIGLAVELNRLSFQWPSLAIGELFRRLHLVNWLRLPPKDRGHVAEALPDVRSFLEMGLPSDDLPLSLMGILEVELESSVTTAGPQRLKLDSDLECQWKRHYWAVKFLRKLSSGTLELELPKAAKPPMRISLQNREMTYVRSVEGTSTGDGVVYQLGDLPIFPGALYRFRLSNIVAEHLDSAKWRFNERPEETERP